MLKTVSSIVNSIGALNYKGTWDANANNPALTSSVGTKGDYYVVSTAGSTNLNGISNWGIGDWAAFNGSVWQRVEGGADLNGVNLSVSGTSTLSALTASTALALNASKEVVSVTNTGTGDNVLATSPALITPNIGNATGTQLDIDNIRTDGNRISSTNTNGNIEVIPNGSGQVLLNTTVSKDETTVANGFAMIGGGVSSEVYAGTDTRTYATSYTGGGGTVTLCNIQSRTGGNVSGPIIRITTSYTYTGGSPSANYAIYMITSGGGLAANLVSGVGTYPTITTTQISSGVTGTADIIGNFNGDSHAMFVVEVFGSVNSWGI
jgi:hypothetical protein